MALLSPRSHSQDFVPGRAGCLAKPPRPRARMPDGRILGTCATRHAEGRHVNEGWQSTCAKERPRQSAQP
jgi:hypothetical protein